MVYKSVINFHILNFRFDAAQMLARDVEGRLRGAEILFTLCLNRARQSPFPTAKRIMDLDYGRLVKARRWLALFQHHDAITGTSKALVMQDYGRKLFEALQIASGIVSRCASILLSRDDEEWQRIRLLPALQRPSYDRLPQKMTLELAKDEAQQTLVLYNSDGHFRNEVIRLKISWPYVRVLDPDDRKIRHQVRVNFIGRLATKIAKPLGDILFIYCFRRLIRSGWSSSTTSSSIRTRRATSWFSSLLWPLYR